jgi:predicted transposase YdaD
MQDKYAIKSCDINLVLTTLKSGQTNQARQILEQLLILCDIAEREDRLIQKITERHLTTG